MKYLLLLGILSCATTQNTEPLSNKNLKKYLKAACLTGEGKGRVEIGSDQFLFDYGSQLERNIWMLGVDVPMRGEEDLIIRKSGKGYFFKGSFYNQLAGGYEQMRRKNKSYKRDYLTKFLHFMGQNIFQIQKFSKMKKSEAKSYFADWCGPAPVEKCTFKLNGKTFEVTSNSLRIAKRLENFDLTWTFKGYNNDLSGHYEKSELVLRKGRKAVMGVMFFHQSCQSETTPL